MARFPIRQAEIINLAAKLAEGLKTHPEIFPNCPVDGDLLNNALNQALESLNQVNESYSRYKTALREKDDRFDELAGMMKKDIRYAENCTDFNDEQLKLLGWSGRRRRGSLKPPGQVMALKVGYNIDGMVILKWKKPSDGGKIAVYEILAEVDDAGFRLAASSVFESVKLTEQPPGKKVRYKVIAVNKAGKGKASNTVDAVV